MDSQILDSLVDKKITRDSINTIDLKRKSINFQKKNLMETKILIENR